MSKSRSRSRSRRTRRSRGGNNNMAAPMNAPMNASMNAPMDVPPMPANMGNMGNKANNGNGSKNQAGGRRKSRKLSKGASDWTQKVTKLYREMKAKDGSVRFGDALKRASALKKKGQL